jgi:hypothetical protein
MKPRVSILSPDFKYVPSVRTDIAQTFANIRREQREQAKRQRLAETANTPIRMAAANDAARNF